MAWVVDTCLLIDIAEADPTFGALATPILTKSLHELESAARGDLQDYEARFGKNLRSEYNGELDRLMEAGLIEIDSQSLKLTTRGALLSNEVFAALA